LLLKPKKKKFILIGYNLADQTKSNFGSEYNSNLFRDQILKIKGIFLVCLFLAALVLALGLNLRLLSFALHFNFHQSQFTLSQI